MQSDAYPSVSLHNVTELEPAEWTDGGKRLARVPGDVGANLNVTARDRVRNPTGCELRFVPKTDDATVDVTLSAAAEATVQPFWGEFQSNDSITVGPEPTTVEFEVPERIRALTDDGQTAGAFDPQVCRLRFDAWSPVAVHDVTGKCRPPNGRELPDYRYLAYGTSITEGAVSEPHLSYVSQAAHRLGSDPLNLGMAGAAFCEPAIADYLAGREDWDVATLSLSVNMANRGFTLEQFHKRAEYLVNKVARAHPTKPIVCISLFPYHADLVRDNASERATEFRAALRTIVTESPNDNLSLIEGPTLMTATGLMDDILHPGDNGMIEIGSRLAEKLDVMLN